MSPAVASEVRSGGAGRILVVDDDRLVLATLAHGLKQAGYDVIDADNGDEAILLAREHRPVLALLDIRMEGLSGFDVAETLRDAYHIPFMFLSAFADEATLAKVREMGALDYLTKPLDVERILPSVAAAMARIAGPAAGREDGAPAAAASVAVQAASPLSDPVALAVGVLMHRHALTRDKAWGHLQRLARDGGIDPAAQAERLLAAVEELARTAP